MGGMLTGGMLFMQANTLGGTPPALGSSAILQWLQIVLSLISVLVIIFGIFKVVNRNNEEWRERERRLVAIEEELSEIRKEGKEIIAMGAQFVLLTEEMKRVRDRLDLFLDRPRPVKMGQ